MMELPQSTDATVSSPIITTTTWVNVTISVLGLNDEESGRTSWMDLWVHFPSDGSQVDRGYY